MMTRETWLALAERCEKATGPDREIDGKIAHALRPGVLIRGFYFTPYTASLDAITALIERELPGTSWRIHWRGIGRNCCGMISRLGPDDYDEFNVEFGDEVAIGRGYRVATPALALCAAFCRAMAEKAE